MLVPQKRQVSRLHPLAIKTTITMENCPFIDDLAWFTHWTWWSYIAMWNDKRVHFPFLQRRRQIHIVPQLSDPNGHIRRAAGEILLSCGRCHCGKPKGHSHHRKLWEVTMALGIWLLLDFFCWGGDLHYSSTFFGHRLVYYWLSCGIRMDTTVLFSGLPQYRASKSGYKQRVS